MSPRAWMHVGVGAVTLLCSLFAFSPGFDNGFWRDDFVYLERSHQVHQDPGVLFQRWVEPFNRPLSQLAFFVEYNLWGFDSGAYIISNAMIHALNATLLFALFNSLIGPQAALVAAVFFALGFGFYGKAVLWGANLPELLATTFVLGTGIASLRAQLARTPQKRLAAMSVAGVLFLMALLSKESGIMALVLAAGIMWPHRRSIPSILRKLSLLVVICVVYVAFQIASDTGIGRVFDDPVGWLRLPLRALNLAAFMTLPVQGQSTLVENASPLLERILALIDQMRPIHGILLFLLGALWFIRGSGGVRWLLVSFFALLLPFGFIQLQGSWLDIRYAYLPATCFCGLLAVGLRQLWARSHRPVQLLLAACLILALYADLALVRRLEAKYDRFGRSNESQAALEKLRARLQFPEQDS